LRSFFLFSASLFRCLFHPDYPVRQSRIAEELMRGIEADDNSRQDWIEQREKGMQLLGLRPELPGLGGSADGAPVEGISRVRHPLLLEAVLRFQANARSELLPTDGPVKIRNATTTPTLPRIGWLTRWSVTSTTT
jgi:hypothetical protein